MSLNIKKTWEQIFLEERPSIGISFFRIFAALTVGLHVIPSFFCLKDNFLSTAFKEVNINFFPLETIQLVQKSPDILVLFFVGLFCVSWFFFFIGLFSQGSCIVMVFSCYYFYALNCFHIGTLSWDILLVTLFLMCLTDYHGDYFSVDCLIRNDPLAYKRTRPIFIQRLLQMQIASTFFYTALYKTTAEGNWFCDNPIYYLLNYPPEGVTKDFIFRHYFAVRPEVCYGIGIGIIVMEYILPFLLFIPQTRYFAIVYGFLFHIMLVTTLHVPTIFFFLFPPQLLLFINPDHVVRWIEQKRTDHLKRGQYKVIYDGKCQFCIASIKKLMVMDMFGFLEKVDFQQMEDVKALHPKLTKELCHSQLHLIEPDGRLLGGFFIFRRLSLMLPMLYPFIILFYFPGSGLVGSWAYRWVAKNRYLFHFNHVCKDNACFR